MWGSDTDVVNENVSYFGYVKCQTRVQLVLMMVSFSMFPSVKEFKC